MFFSGRFIEYVLEREDVQPAWKQHTEHDFVAGLADGTLPVESFKYYLIQDYLFLVGLTIDIRARRLTVSRFNLLGRTLWQHTKQRQLQTLQQ